MTIAQIAEMLGWMSLINISVLMIATVAVTTMRDQISSIHRRLFAVSEQEMALLYLNFLSQYKVVTLAFMVAPYFALKIMGA